MLKVSFDRPSGATYRILCLGAHSDDIEIGCGGTIINLLTKYSHVAIYWVVFSANPERETEAKTSAGKFLVNAESSTIIVKNFRDSFFPFIGSTIKEFFEELKKEFYPDIIFTHNQNDRHQDHRLVSDLTWNTFRDHLILEYEIPKYDGDLGSPNLFVHLDEPVVHAKIEGILNCFKSQANNRWFSQELFMSILRVRGIECNASSGFAEAFYCRKMII